MRRLLIFMLSISTMFASGCSSPDSPAAIPVGLWRAVLELPGGELPFSIELGVDQGRYVAFLINGPERVRVPEVWLASGRMSLVMPAFNNRIEAVWEDSQLAGTLTLVKRAGERHEMPFVAQPGMRHRFSEAPVADIDVSGRWDATFVEDDGTRTKAIGEFRQSGSGLLGTFLTPKGDYRYLAGEVAGDGLYLSTFDGAHAFLFKARLDANGQLNGDFWSGIAWHETWTAVRDENVELPDPMALTFLKSGHDQLEFSFPDLQGRSVSLNDERFHGDVVLVALVGSWCPNCHDETAFLTSLYESNRERGLSVIALMYEHLEGSEAVEQVRRFQQKFGIEYDLLLAGSSDKQKAAETLPMLNHVMAFPTTIFIDRAGEIRKIHTGFAGPGTGRHYDRLREEFAGFVDELLEEGQL